MCVCVGGGGGGGEKREHLSDVSEVHYFMQILYTHVHVHAATVTV